MYFRPAFTSFCLSVLLFLLSGCTRHAGYSPTLLEAESLMDTRPDTVLTILESIAQPALRSEADRALYGLLLTQALDKNHRPIAGDSLAGSAARYFSKVQDPERQMVATYYEGRARYQNGLQDSALISFFRAKDIAEAIDRPFWAGMACRGISDIHHDSYNKVEELRYAKLEYENIQKSQRQPYVNYAILDLARANCGIANYDTCNSLCLRIADSALKYQDVNLYQQAINIRLTSNAMLGNYIEGEVLFKHMTDLGIATADDSIFHAINLCGLHRFKDALECIDNNSAANDLHKHYIKYLAYKGLGDSQESLSNLEALSKIENGFYTLSFRKDPSAFTSQLKDNENELITYQLKVATQKMWLTIGMFIAISACLIMAFIYIRNRYNRSINDKVLIADNLKELLKKENEKALTIVSKLLPSKYELITRFCEIVIESSDSKSAKAKISDTVDTLIKNMTVGTSQITDIEIYVNDNYNNVLIHLKEDFPTLKEADYLLFVFNALKFPNPVIALLLKADCINSIYDRKRRLKDRIKKNNPQRTNLYLNLLS